VLFNHPGERLGRSSLIAGLREDLRRLLPPYMIPSSFVPVAEFPVTASGKIDRSRLPAPGAARSGKGRGPAGHAEETLCLLASGLLGVDEVWADDDFFEIGGDSIKAVMLASHASASGISVSVRDVFEQRTAGALARVAARRAGSAAPPGPGAQVARRPLVEAAEAGNAAREWDRLQNVLRQDGQNCRESQHD
jgi:hypothetical protein